MLYYEIKKVFSKTSNRIVLFVLGMILLIIIGLCVNSVVWVNEEGYEEKGFSAINKLRETKNEWSGLLTEDKIAQVIQENLKLNRKYLSKGKQQENIAYGKKQGFSDIRELINRSFSPFRDYDYYTIDSISITDAYKFYTNRIKSLDEWLTGEAKDQFSKGEKDYFINQYKKMKNPLEYRYQDGWKYLMEYSSTLIIITVVIICILIAPIFSCEKQLKADSVFYSSFNGRNKAITTKIKAGILIMTGIYWITIIIYTTAILGIFGIEGKNCMIQTNGMWKSFYNLTNFQEYLLIIFGSYICCIFMSSLTMYVSAHTNSTAFSAIVSFVVIFAPSMLSSLSSNDVVSKFLGVFPDQLLNLNRVVSLFLVYKIGDKYFNPFWILFILYIFLIIIIQPLTYQIFRRKELS